MHQKTWLYATLFLRYGCDGCNCYFPFWAIFCPFTAQKIKILKKWKIHLQISSLYTINDNHMMYGSWGTKCNKQNFLSFWAIFCPFAPLTTQKIKFLKKWKKHLEISSFYTSVPKIMIIYYAVPEQGLIQAKNDSGYCFWAQEFLHPNSTIKLVF